MREQISLALPPQVTVDKFLRVAITAIQQAPSLLSAERNSLFAAIVTSAQLGLVPDSQLGEAYFVPFKGKVQLIPGYRGLLKLARQGDIGFVEAELIHQNDDVKYVLGDDSHFEAKVNWRDRGPIEGVYALARFRDGGIAARVVMMKHQVDAIRARSQAANGPAWSDNYEEMMKKTALRRLAKLLPLSTSAASAFRVSELHEEQDRHANVIEGQVIAESEGEDKTDAPPAPKSTTPTGTAPESKPKRRASALDHLPQQPAPGPQPPSDERPDLKVDPETGQILNEGELDFGDDDGHEEKGHP